MPIVYHWAEASITLTVIELQVSFVRLNVITQSFAIVVATANMSHIAVNKIVG